MGFPETDYFTPEIEFASALTPVTAFDFTRTGVASQRAPVYAQCITRLVNTVASGRDHIGNNTCNHNQEFFGGKRVSTLM